MIAALSALFALTGGAHSRTMFQTAPMYAPPPIYGMECSPRFAACGGVNWDGPTCCFEGDVCQFQSVYFSQCVPSQDSTPPVYGGCAARADQCGGAGWTGATCCLGDDVCIAQSTLYSECGPASPPVSSPPVELSPPSSSPPAELPPAGSPPPLSPYVPGIKTFDPACAMRWGACGGQNFEGKPCCNGDNVCVFSSYYFSMCTPTQLPPTIAREFHMCGGANWTGPRQCEALTECTILNEFTSLCVSVFPSPPPPPPSPPIAPRPDGCADRFGQCGGILAEDARCCAPGNVCVKQNPWYSQCIAQRPLAEGIKGWWDHCGDNDVCEAGSTCTVKNEWYSICMPDRVV